MEGTLESKEGQVIIAGTFKGNITAKSLTAKIRTVSAPANLGNCERERSP